MSETAGAFTFHVSCVNTQMFQDILEDVCMCVCMHVHGFIDDYILTSLSQLICLGKAEEWPFPLCFSREMFCLSDLFSPTSEVLYFGKSQTGLWSSIH